MVTEKAQITVSYSFVNQKIFNKYTFPIFKQYVGFN